MGIREFFTKTPEAEIDREKALRDPEQILAWLEELSRIGSEIDLDFPNSDHLPVAGKVKTVSEDMDFCSILFKYKPAKEPSPGQRMHAVFPLDGKRFQTSLVYQGRGNYLEYRFGLPSAILHAERRESVRVKMRPGDHFNIVVLQGLFEGLGFSGVLVDLSMGGCCFRAERVIQIQSERRLAIASDMLAAGTSFALVRLTNLPRLPLVECGACLCSMRQSEGAVLLALRFEGLGAFERGILGKFLSERVPGYSVRFPHKRRIRDLAEEELTGPQADNRQDAPEDASLHGGKAQEHDEINESQEATDALDPELQEPLTDEARLNKLRKRGKRILIAMGDELERVVFMAMLHQDGYRCLFEAKSLVQALNHHRNIALDLLMVDHTIGHMNAVSFVDVLRDQGLPKSVPVVVMQRKIDHQLALAEKAGTLSYLVDHPVDFPGSLKQPLERLLGLAVPES
jgi:CheY-like chemotaxis protein